MPSPIQSSGSQPLKKPDPIFSPGVTKFYFVAAPIILILAAVFAVLGNKFPDFFPALATRITTYTAIGGAALLGLIYLVMGGYYYIEREERKNAPDPHHRDHGSSLLPLEV